jgi:hypothetical protein
VSKEKPTNIAASVRDRLIAIAKRDGEEVEQLLTRYCVERFLYRLGQSPYVGRFLLKGAMLFVAWEGRSRRPTRDADLLGFGDLAPEKLSTIVAAICAIPCPEDGVTFLADSVRVNPIREDQAYGGQRVVVDVRLGQARLRCQVDVGLGDVVTPGPVEGEFPSLLSGLPRTTLRMYPRETVVAEKLEAMVQLGIANGRMKDFYDLWYLSRAYPFAGRVLSAAVRATFARRDTALPEGVPVSLGDEMLVDRTKLTQWAAFLRATKFTEPTWADLIRTLRPFLLPLLATTHGSANVGRWEPGGPWVNE